jgi:hypothetical protein
LLEILVWLRLDARCYPDNEERFNAMQNAIVSVEAERYYRRASR